LTKKKKKENLNLMSAHETLQIFMGAHHLYPSSQSCSILTIFACALIIFIVRLNHAQS